MTRSPEERLASLKKREEALRREKKAVRKAAYNAAEAKLRYGGVLLLEAGLLPRFDRQASGWNCGGLSLRAGLAAMFLATMRDLRERGLKLWRKLKNFFYLCWAPFGARPSSFRIEGGPYEGLLVWCVPSSPERSWPSRPNL